MNEKPDEPPLIDLIDKNVAHYQVNSDLRHGAHFTALPTLFLAGIDADSTGNAPKILIGGSAAITSPHPEARGEYIEFQGQGLGALEKMLDRMERQMAISRRPHDRRRGEAGRNPWRNADQARG
jgi:hypothetical protein